MSMLYIGIIIYNMKPKEIKWDKSMTIIVIGRFLFAPMIVLLLCTISSVPALMKHVFTIQAAMPAMSITSVQAEAAGGDYKYAAIVTTMTTIVTLLIIYLALCRDSCRNPYCICYLC